MNASSFDAANDPRHLLGRFLRARREAAPADAGAMKGFGRRRTPGLRREEVAQRAGISTTWYTWLEQGRDIALSPSALARLADALSLSAAERAYLFELARRRDPVRTPFEGASSLAPEWQQAVAAMPMPAYLLDRMWCLRAWNDAAAELFAPWLASGEACLLRYVFLHASARELICDWEERAHRLVAEFRADTALYPDDSGLIGLVAELQRESRPFQQFWNQHDVLAREGGSRRFHHPRLGRVERTQVTLLPSSLPDHKLVLLLPEAGGPDS
ncbi:helix-turn-helix domain-containing protein [Dyella halodurans]|uniref:Helix-turn-helix transcriptional regulator n=1 Tax=Dyella halodurans TaxID=1920171 RepID=A0ABV9BYQ1_9GAMM|nr:helix-turn-helix transcriptional regulator [Dyella halodurans]